MNAAARQAYSTVYLAHVILRAISGSRRVGLPPLNLPNSEGLLCVFPRKNTILVEYLDLDQVEHESTTNFASTRFLTPNVPTRGQSSKTAIHEPHFLVKETAKARSNGTGVTDDVVL